MDRDPKQKREGEVPSTARRYGLFGVSAYPKESGLDEKQRSSMARWAGVVVILLAAMVLFLVVAGSNSGGLTVTFDSQGGSAAARQSVPYGGTASDPGEVIRPGYTLVCWSLTPDGGQPWDFDSDVVCETLTLYAVWEPAS